MVGDVSFSSAEVAVIAAMLAALSTPLAVLFHALRSSYLDRIKEHRSEIDNCQRRAEEMRPTLEGLTGAVREQSRLIERLVDDRERVRAR